MAMDVREWIRADLQAVRDRLERGVVQVIPAARAHERVAGGVAPVAVMWHTARHHDVAVHRIVRGAPEVLDDWAGRVGIAADTWRGLAEREDAELTASLDAEAVGAYLLDVFARSVAWLDAEPLPALDARPDAAGALDALGTPRDRFDWLYAMWDAKPVEFFLRWEAVGHGYNHLGELVAIRDAMGLSPF